MPSHRRHRGRRRTSRFAWEMAFEAQVRQVPDGERAGLLAWLRDWRQRPRRTFLVMDDVGHWYLLT
jgi:hypothetical protein